MRRSKIEHYIHLVWTTKDRDPCLTPELERAVHHCLSNQAERMKCVVRAIGGMPDHVHMVIWLPATLSVAELVKNLKGTSSAFINDEQRHESHFRWQEGYAVFSVSRSHLAAVTAYVLNQKQHHAEETLRPTWEETDMEV